MNSIIGKGKILKPMNRIQWTESLRNRRIYRVSERMLGDKAGFDARTPVISRGADMSELPVRARLVAENLLANEHIESVEISHFDIKVKVGDFSFGRHAIHMHCLATLHQYLWGQDADVLVTQESFLG